MDLAPAVISLEPSSGRDGFDEECLRWWPRRKTGAEAAAALVLDEDARVAVEGAEATTRRTEEGSMLSVTRASGRQAKRARG